MVEAEIEDFGGFDLFPFNRSAKANQPMAYYSTKYTSTAYVS